MVSTEIEFIFCKRQWNNTGCYLRVGVHQFRTHNIKRNNTITMIIIIIVIIVITLNL